MISLTINPPTQQATIIKCRPARAYVNGMRRRDLEVTSWELLPGPVFGRARLVVKAQRSADGTRNVEDRSRLPGVGTEVLIRPAPRPAATELDGIVTIHTVQVGLEQQYAAEIEHRLGWLLKTDISGRWHMESASLVHIEEAKVRFNTGDAFLASAEPMELNGRSTRVFSSASDARPWSVADALAYLFATTLPGYVSAPSPEELDTLTEELPLDSEDITGLSAAKAIMKIAELAGMEVRAARRGLGLVLFRPGRDGQRRFVRLQPGGSQLDLARTNLHKGKIISARRPSRPGVVAVGEVKLFESTFTLLPGWDDSLETSRWRDFIRSESEAWPGLADVYRRWVLNEHGRYSDGPWELPRFDLATLSADDFLTSQPKQLLPSISRDAAGSSLGTPVEYRCGAGKPWRKWPGPVWTSRDQCAVYLGGDELPGDYFEAAAAHEAEVRVTASVRADTRLTVTIAGDPAAGREIVRFPGVGAFRHVCESSIFHDLGASGEQDDTDVLRRLALRRAGALASATETELSLGWINSSFHVGNIIDRVDGRLIELASNPDRRPHVHSVRHKYGRTQSTILTIRG